MPQLLLDHAGGIGNSVKNGAANTTVTVHPSTDWSAVTIAPGDVGWVLHKPIGSAATLSGAYDAVENKTFVPDVPGRYLVLLHGRVDGAPATRTALFEVASALSVYTAPAYKEKVEYGDTGWATSVEGALRELSRHAAGQTQLVRCRSIQAVSAFQLVRVFGVIRHEAKGVTSSSALSSPGAYLLEVEPVVAASNADNAIYLLMLQEADANEAADALLVGLAPISLIGLSEGPLYVSGTGALTNTADTIRRRVGTYIQAASAALLSTTPIPLVYFNGLPEYSRVLGVDDKRVVESPLVAGVTAHTVLPTILSADAVSSMSLLYPAGGTAPDELSMPVRAAHFRVVASCTDVTKGYNLILRRALTGDVLATAVVDHLTPESQTLDIVIGSGAGQFPDSTPELLELVAEEAEIADYTAEVLTVYKASIIVTGGV